MTTTNLVRRLDTPIVWMGFVINVVFIAAIAATLGRNTPAPVAVPTPSLPIIMIATAQSAAVVAVERGNLTPRALVAYDQPDGVALGAIEAGRVYTVTASYGAEWLQADVAGSGLVWLRAGALLGRPEGIADLRPTDAPVIVREAPIVVYQPVETTVDNINSSLDAAPTPAPAVPPPSLRGAAILDRQQWARAVATAAAGR